METEPPEVVVFAGLQASGKSTFYRRFLKGTHAKVSKDDFRNNSNRDRRQEQLLREAMGAGRSVVVDNTNPTPEDRAPLVALAREFGYRAVAMHFDAEVGDCLARNAARTGRERVPEAGVLSTARKLVAPRHSEGFDQIVVVRMLPTGDFDIIDMERDEDG